MDFLKNEAKSDVLVARNEKDKSERDLSGGSSSGSQWVSLADIKPQHQVTRDEQAALDARSQVQNMPQVVRPPQKGNS